MIRIAVLLVALTTLPAFANPEIIDHGRFEHIALYRPAGPVKSVVLFLSGDGGWQRQSQLQAELLQAQGALVAGIDSAQFMRALEADGGDCVFPDGDLENLSHFIQAYAQLPGYRAPILAGYSAGATLAYATLAQAPTNTFSAGLVTGFCPDLALKKPLCPGDGLLYSVLPAKAGAEQAVLFKPRPSLAAPFVALLGSEDRFCAADATQQFIQHMPAARQTVLKRVNHNYGDHPASRAALAAAFQVLAKRKTPTERVPPAPAELGDLPVIAMPAAGSNPYLALLWSGDGGWAGLDKGVAEALQARGIAVVGVDSLRYFWRARTPQGIAEDIEKIASHYLDAWQKKKLILIGYSQGADVLPFAINQLSAPMRQQVTLAATMGLGAHASFEFHLGDWLSDSDEGPEILPEIQRIKGLPFLCIYGADDEESICPQLKGGSGSSRVIALTGGHHFDGDYAALAKVIIGALPSQ